MNIAGTFSREPMPVEAFHDLLRILAQHFPEHRIEVAVTHLLRVRRGSGKLNFELTLRKRS